MQLVCPSCGTTNRIPDARLRDAPVRGRCQAALMAAEPFNLSDAAQPGFIARTELPVLDDFWADWYGPRKQMVPHVPNAASQLPKVRFAKVDSDAAPAASARFSIRSIATLILFRVGAEVARLSGAVPAIQLVTWLRRQPRLGAA